MTLSINQTMPPPTSFVLDKNGRATVPWYNFWRILASNNSDFLLASLNLSDVDNPAAALANIGGSPEAGSTDIVTVGTITTGTWNGSIIQPAFGGTGINNGTKTITIGGNVLFSGAFPSIFNFTGSTNVTFPISGTLATTSQLPANPLPLTQGGTNKSLTAANGGIVYTDTDSMEILTPTATAGQILRSGSSSAPNWSTATFATSYGASQLLYSNGANTVQGLTTGNNGTLITDGSGVPSISSTLPSAVQANITTVGTIGTGTWNATTIGVTKGGTGLTSASQGDLLYGSASNTYSSLAKNTTATRYLANTGTSNNPNWDQVNLTNGVTGTLPVANGGTGITSLGSGVATFLGTPSSANLASAVTDETGSGALVFATSPTLVTPTLGAATATSVTFSPSTGGIVGTTTNNNASAGIVGETQEVGVPANTVTLTSGTPANLTSISLSAGDWFVSGNVAFFGDSATDPFVLEGWLNTTSATNPGGQYTSYQQPTILNPYVNAPLSITTPPRRFSLSTTTTVYLSTLTEFSGGAMQGGGSILALRIR